MVRAHQMQDITILLSMLDGDEGDYVAIDLDAEHGDIGQFVDQSRRCKV